MTSKQKKLIINFPNEEFGFESLHINTKLGKIKGRLRYYSYRDKDTRQIVIHIPSIDVSGYGATKEKAEEMIKFSVKEFCDYLLQLSPTSIKSTLINLGFVNDKFRSKDYSKSYVDMKGELQEFAVAGEVEEAAFQL